MKATLALVIALLVLVVGCEDLAAPNRTPRYLADLAGETFHWPPDRLPVRYYADPRGAMPALISRGLRVWESQFLYGEFKGVFVADSNLADVIVRWQDNVPPDVPPDTAGALGACDGLTTYVIDSTHAITDPLRVQLRVRLGFTTAQVAACLPRVATHELGHSLGILGHSPATTDLMYGTPATDTPTIRDRNTAQVLYHTPATLTPPPR